MSSGSCDRRTFIGTAFAATVVSLLLPGEILAGAGGPYIVHLSDHPELSELYRSVRLSFVDIGNNILVTRVGAGRFVAVSDRCTHIGCGVNDMAPDTRTYTCPCHGARFAEDGSSLSAIAPQPLERYWITYDGLDTLTIESAEGAGITQEAQVVGAIDMVVSDGRLRVDLVLRRSGHLTVLLVTMVGEVVMHIDGGLVPAGARTIVEDLTGLAGGAYFCRVQLDRDVMSSRKVLVR